MSGQRVLLRRGLGRRLLFGAFSAHPERLEPAVAMCGFRASTERPVYLHDVGHVPMLDEPTGIADLVRDLITRATGPGAFAEAPRARQEGQHRGRTTICSDAGRAT